MPTMVQTPPPPAPTPPSNMTTSETSERNVNPTAEVNQAENRDSQAVLKPSIYQVFFPVSTAKDGANARNPYRCIKHILAILAKHCDGQLKVLPHDDHKGANEDICLWSDFPSEAEHAKAYLFNIQSPRQSFGQRAGQNFRAEFRVSCSSSVRWMKNKPAVASELARHQYWVTGRANGPTVQMRPILWLVRPDPDNCSAAQLKQLLMDQLPPYTPILLEKHRLVCRPDPKNKQIFITHALKVLAPSASAWTVKKTLETYLHDTPDAERHIILRGVRSAGLSAHDISKMELSALITVQNDHLNKSTAVQVANVWTLTEQIEFTEQLIHMLETDKLAPQYKQRKITDFLPDPSTGSIRELMYAVLGSREDIGESPILNDYIRGGHWNIVCEKECINAVTTFLEWFIHILNTTIGVENLAKTCGSHKPYDPNKQPRVSSVKQYNEAASCRMETSFGCRMDSFMKKYNLSTGEEPESTTPPDLTRPPKETFRPTHHAKMRTLPLDRPSWASTLYESSFAAKEPAKNPYAKKRFQSYAAATTSPVANTPLQTKTRAEVNSTPVPPSQPAPPPIPQNAMTATTTNVSSLTPMTPAPTNLNNRTVTPIPISPVLADTQDRLSKLSSEIDIMKDHRKHLDSRLDTIEQGQNVITKSVQEMAESINQLLKAQKERDQRDNAYDNKIENLRREFNSAMEKNVADIHAGAIEMLKNRCDYQDSDEDMSEPSTSSRNDSEGTDSDSNDTYHSHVSITNIPYPTMTQFGDAPAEESTSVTADGHLRQTRPNEDVAISGSG